MNASSTQQNEALLRNINKSLRFYSGKTMQPTARSARCRALAHHCPNVRNVTTLSFLALEDSVVPLSLVEANNSPLAEFHAVACYVELAFHPCPSLCSH